MGNDFNRVVSVMKITPQKGYQMDFLKSAADIVVGGGAAGCFASDTLVLTQRGYKKISEVKEGEHVLSVDLSGGYCEFREVLQVFKYSGTHSMCSIVTDCLTIKCTATHDFYFRGGWVHALDLELSLISKYNPSTFRYKIQSNKDDIKAREISGIKSITHYKSNEYVYDLCVSGNHNYCITDKNILVHNSGKTFSLLLESVRHTGKKKYRGVIFRRTFEQIKMSGGLWDTSQDVYSVIGGKAREQQKDWTFPSGSKISFHHLQYEKDKQNYQGGQFAFVGFDELTHFTKSQFFYIVTRARSLAGVRTYFRATCNPDPDSWVAELIGWWIDEESGYPIPERSGKIKYFTQDSNRYVWGDTPEEVRDKAPHIFSDERLKGKKIEDLVKSITFIPGTIDDNQLLIQKSPEYLGNLLAQDDETRDQLLKGNWKVKVDDKELINYFKMRDSFTNEHVLLDENGNRRTDLEYYITADIALHGSDRFVVYVWYGWAIVDIYESQKMNGKEVVDTIQELALMYGVGRSNIIYDGDGIGAYIEGYLSGARAFVNNSKSLGKEKYDNLKTQCAYKLSEVINEGKMYVVQSVADRTVMVGKKATTVQKQMISERRCLKREKPDSEDKLRIISKEKMKIINSSHSPDFLDALIFRAWFDVLKNSKTIKYG